MEILGDARMLQDAGVGSWSEDEINAVWRAALGKWPLDDVRAATICATALLLGMTAEETVARIEAAEGGAPMLPVLAHRGADT